VTAWEALTGREVRSYSGLGNVGVLRWHPTQPEIVISTPYGFLYNWNVETGQMGILPTEIGVGSVAYSPFGGQLSVSITNDATIKELLQTQAEQYRLAGGVDNLVAETVYTSRSSETGTLQILVPLPTLDRFAQIAASCGAPASLTPPDTALQATAAIAAEAGRLETQLDALPAGAIPAGCAADLRAIAQAMQAQGE
jgi:hypothetical protein